MNRSPFPLNDNSFVGDIAASSFCCRCRRAMFSHRFSKPCRRAGLDRLLAEAILRLARPLRMTFRRRCENRTL